MKKILSKQGTLWNNDYYEMDDYCLLRIYKNNEIESYDVKIDMEDVCKVSKGQWFVLKQNYKRNKPIHSIIWSTNLNDKRVNYHIHQLILNTKLKDKVVDHINNDRFDNRKTNLRITTSKINSINIYHKGYYLENKTGKYLARVRYNNKDINIGRYSSEKEAEEVYLKGCIILGYNKISTSLKERIEKLGIKELTEEEIRNNRYLSKLKAITDGAYNPDNYNGKMRMEYLDNINIIKSLREEGNSWNGIAKRLVGDGYMKHAKGETIKRYWEKYANKIIK